jgi:hypothetical protein
MSGTDIEIVICNKEQIENSIDLYLCFKKILMNTSRKLGKDDIREMLETVLREIC